MIERNCDSCDKPYKADVRNLKRGWGLCCSKSCAAKKREMSRPDYDPEIVKENNKKRNGHREPNYFYEGQWDAHKEDR